MSWGGFWDAIGGGFAKIGLWAAKNPMTVVKVVLDATQGNIINIVQDAGGVVTSVIADQVHPQPTHDTTPFVPPANNVIMFKVPAPKIE